MSLQLLMQPHMPCLEGCADMGHTQEMCNRCTSSASPDETADVVLRVISITAASGWDCRVGSISILNLLLLIPASLYIPIIS